MNHGSLERMIAEILGYTDTRHCLLDHIDSDDRKSLKYKAWVKMAPTLWNKPNDFMDKTIINESGMYALIFGSKLPSAKKFKRWVTSEVLPSIRKTGHYGNTPLKDVINLIRITRDNMEKQGASPTQIAETINGICEQYGINLPNFCDTSRTGHYEKMCLIWLIMFFHSQGVEVTKH